MSFIIAPPKPNDVSIGPTHAACSRRRRRSPVFPMHTKWGSRVVNYWPPPLHFLFALCVRAWICAICATAGRPAAAAECRVQLAGMLR